VHRQPHHQTLKAEGPPSQGASLEAVYCLRRARRSLRAFGDTFSASAILRTSPPNFLWHSASSASVMVLMEPTCGLPRRSS
jgi:hypothetical protein